MRVIALVPVLLVLVSNRTMGQTNTQDGLILGGLTGAIAGGIIGNQNGETPEGALIGGAVGALTGGLIGNAKDQRIAQQRQQQYQYQTWQAQQRAVTTHDIMTMRRGGVTDPVMMAQIRANGVDRRLTTSDIIALHQEGVSEAVIHSMQNAHVAGTSYVPARPAPRTVIVRERYVAPYSYHWYHAPCASGHLWSHHHGHRYHY